MICMEFYLGEEPASKVTRIEAYNYVDSKVEIPYLYCLEPRFVEEQGGVCCFEIWNGAMRVKIGRSNFPIKDFHSHLFKAYRVMVDDHVHALIFEYLKNMEYKPRNLKVWLGNHRKWDMDCGLDEWVKAWGVGLPVKLV